MQHARANAKCSQSSWPDHFGGLATASFQSHPTLRQLSGGLRTRTQSGLANFPALELCFPGHCHMESSNWLPSHLLKLTGSGEEAPCSNLSNADKKSSLSGLWRAESVSIEFC